VLKILNGGFSMNKIKFLKLITVVALCLISTSAFAATVIEIPIAEGRYDVEEHLDDGDLDNTSSDLEFPYEDTGPADAQLLGLFFTGVDIAPGSIITEAYVRFDVDETRDGGEANVLIRGELADNYPVVPVGLSGRTMTDAVKWSPDEWDTTHVKHNTSDISAIVQQIIDQAEWVSGGTIALQISDDPDDPSVALRVAESFEGAGTNLDRIPTLVLTVVPEPASMILLGIGALGLIRRKR
jgi:hypothetical protein